ncbi:Calcineurin-like metallo-phosphoesterase superfamily protein [Zea mays]|uniref:Calcineurin-like metallo-phosphoesterase superfamily protein n=2 Tax=Zea mays TaxID=4577 RepID=A0A1D6HBY2_MAIZE|nr:Calcineurin-like metallo-phosphoesterase superfamily protein [Zea mays]
MAATFALLLLLILSSSVRAAPDAVVSRIAFGSCANQSEPQPIWNAVAGFDPQVFVWLGDNVYGDNKRPFRVFGRERTVGPWKNVPRFYPSTEEELRRRYQLARAQPGYARLRERAQVLGTWDDHDYGLNDAGKELSGKVIAQRLMLDFLDEPEDSKRYALRNTGVNLFSFLCCVVIDLLFVKSIHTKHIVILGFLPGCDQTFLFKRKQAGVYASYMFGPEGKRVKVILLDTRYHRDPLLSDGTILGDPQWQWLERELHGPQSEITIIGSSIQVVSNLSATTGPLFYVESWARFPRERERLFRLIDSSKRPGVLFISGDVHFGEITRFDCGAEYPSYDVTSSGLTQSVENSVPEVFQPLMRLLAILTPTTMRVLSPNCQYKSCTIGQPNFGAIEIDWNAVPPRIKLELRDVEGHSVHSVEFPISELQPSEAHAIKRQTHTFQRHCTLETELPWLTRYRLALMLFVIIAVFAVVVVMLAIACLSNFTKSSKKSKKE